MGVSILLFFIPILAVLAIVKLYFHWKYTWQEFGVQSVATLAVLAMVFFAGYANTVADTKLINGVVTETNAVKRNCPVGWQDFPDSFCTNYITRSVKIGETCTTDDKGRRTCTPIYKTEYNHIYPWERRYFVKTDIPNSYEIDREDNQGEIYPARFTEIELGDPVAVSVGYQNYIKGAADSLFSKDAPVEPVPIAYPRVKDYYKANRVIITGYPSDNNFYNEWNESLAEVNANIRKTGANVIVVVTGDGETFAESLARAWEAHNINDVVVTIGMNGDTIAWADVRSWSSNSLVNVEIENEILNLKTLDTAKIDAIIEQAVLDHYELKSMEEFEYLLDDIEPPLWAYIIAIIILLGVTPAVTYYFHKNDVF